MPRDHAERKAAKPALESLALLPDNTLVRLGSAATERPERGWLLPPDREPSEVSLGDLYATLRRTADRNIERARPSRASGCGSPKRRNGRGGRTR